MGKDEEAGLMADTITDVNGRDIEIHRLNKLQMRKFIRAMGAASDIDRWIGEAILAAHVIAIGGVPVIFPRTPDEADALVAKLDNDGIEAVANWVKDTQPSTTEVVAAAKN